MTDCELYIHIPFCVKKCRYCDFASYENSSNLIPEYITALIDEAEWMAPLYADCSLKTVYVGGGTPSLIPPAEWLRLFRGISHFWDFSNVCEFTSEANPESLTKDWLESALSSGVNRISLGMQSSIDSELRFLGRIHSQEQTEKAVNLVRKSGISNLNLDLMFGFPLQTRESWNHTVSNVLALDPDHISAYGLIPEVGTVMYEWLNSGTFSLPDEEVERGMYSDVKQRLLSKGFHQYEISNFAKSGHECLHNIGYWTHVPYLGLGCSASSMLHKSTSPLTCQRFTNPHGLKQYFHMLVQHDPKLREQEYVSASEARFETMMLGLRMTAGVSTEHFFRLHGVSLNDCYGEKLQEQEKLGYTIYKNGYWMLTDRGMDCQNTVLVELMT